MNDLKSILVAVLVLVSIGATSQSNIVYYLNKEGKLPKSGNASTYSSVFTSFAEAVKALKAGDRLIVADGEYVEPAFSIHHVHGTEQAPIVIIAENQLKAVLTRPDADNPDVSVVEIANSSYIVFDGFEVFDSQSGMESGVDVRNSSHHITVKNCYIHDCACGGISSRLSDYLVFDSNIVRDNAKRNKWNCSGLSIWHPVELDQKPGFHIVVKNNVAFENECDIAFSPHGFKNPTDGNGIIIDDFRNTQGGGQEGGYFASVLVENNLSFNNGGRGIAVYKSDNVTLRNNTSFHNLRILTKYIDWAGEISIDHSKGSTVVNNIMLENPMVRSKGLRCYDNDGVNTLVNNNLIVGDMDLCGQTLTQSDNVVLDVKNQDYPKFKHPTIDVKFKTINDFGKYFGLKKKSLAAGKGVDFRSVKH
jgi:parallel beta-helix repeat protein